MHGAYEGFLSILRFTGLADEHGHWAGGKAHLVQTGDVLDRGKDAPKVLDLLMRLEGEARKAGGRVHALLGNHEVMNMLGDLRYVNAEEYEAFRTSESIDRRSRFLRTLTEAARERARVAGRSSTRTPTARSSWARSPSASWSGPRSSRRRGATASGCASGP